ncbi:MAG: PQQ-binding-like beta-propeller repeat protein, partial [Candidatus Eremiobacterota bacterium]
MQVNWQPFAAPTARYVHPQAAADRFEPGDGSTRPPTRQELIRQLLNPDREVKELRVDWKQNIGGRLLSRAGVGQDGRLAFVSDDRLVVLKPDGSEQMSVPQGEPDVFNIFLPPVVDPGGVVAAGGAGLTSFGPSGKKLWHRKIGEVVTRPAVGQDGTVYAAGGDGRMVAFDSRGKKLWATDVRPTLVELYREDREAWCESLRRDLADPDKADRKDVLESLLQDAEQELADPEFGKDVTVKFEGGPSLGPDGRVYCFTQVGPLFSLDGRTGEIQWVQPDTANYLDEGGLSFTPDGQVLGVTGNSLLRCIRPEDGEVLFDYGCWIEKRLDQVSPEEADDARRSGNMGSCGLPDLSPDGETIYWGGRDGKVRAVDRQGNKVFTVEIPHNAGYAGEMDVSVGQDGCLYCANSRGLTVLSSRGEELWRYETSDKYSYATLAGDKVILNTYSGEVVCLDSRDLKQRAEAAAEEDAPAPRIAVGNGWVTVG